MRLRIVAVAVQVQAFVDDGENLTPHPLPPITIPWSRWQEFVDGGFEQALGEVRQQVEAKSDDEAK